MKYSLIIICMLLAVLVHGQSVKLGYRGGMSFSNFYAHHSPGEIPNDGFTTSPPGPVIIDPQPPSYFYETSFTSDMRTGVFSYLYLEYKMKPKLSAEFGLGYTQRGIDMTYNQQGTSVNSSNNTVRTSYQFKRNLRFEYISLPMSIHYALGRKDRFYATAGIYNSIAINFLLKESIVTTERETFDPSGNTLSMSKSTSSSEAAYANLFDSGLLAGIGVLLPMADTMFIGFDLRGTLGLINIPKKYENYGFQSFSKATKNISIETGLVFQYVLK